MSNAASQNHVVVNAQEELIASLAPADVVLLLAGMIASWIAAGSTGFLGHALQHVLTWSALIVALIAAWPRRKPYGGSWVVLAIFTIFGVTFSMSTLPVVQIFAVTVVLAAIAQVSYGQTGRTALIVAMASAALGLFHFACSAIPSVWQGADYLCYLFSWFAAWLTGARLNVGATFGGLDFLVVMAVLYIGWRKCSIEPDRNCRRSALASIVVGQFVYLCVLAHSDKLAAILPALSFTQETEINHLGISTFGNTARSMIPWNLPLVAVLFHCAIATALYGWSVWTPVAELTLDQVKKLQKETEKQDVTGKALLADMLHRFGPTVLAVLVVILVALAKNPCSLKGKTVIAHNAGRLNWLKPQYDSEKDALFGLLPDFVESLGGRFIKADYLQERELKKADIVILIHPDRPWLEDSVKRLMQFVNQGGSLLVVADPSIREGRSQSRFNYILSECNLKFTSMCVRPDTAVPLTRNWEQAYETLYHPATLGLDDQNNCFGFELGSTIRTQWPARPVLVGRWGWADPGSDAFLTGVSQYDPGELLGDLVLAAEQPLEKGRVFVLGSTSPLRNESLAISYPFLGRLFAYLANHPATPQAMWRQVLALLLVLAIGILVKRRPVAWQLLLAPSVLSIVLMICTGSSYSSSRVLPDGRAKAQKGFNNIAYIDASHFGAYDSDLWAKHGLAGLCRTLMRQGYLPLFAHDLSKERLERAGLLISIAPAKEFNAQERINITEFVGNGGTFISMCGAEEAEASNAILGNFQIHIPPSPVPLGSKQIEPEPFGAFRQTFGERRFAQFYAGWPVECTADQFDTPIAWVNNDQEYPIAVAVPIGRGRVIAIGDTHFATNENLESADRQVADNVLFWRWLLSRFVPGHQPWTPTPGPVQTEDKTNDTADDGRAAE